MAPWRPSEGPGKGPSLAVSRAGLSEWSARREGWISWRLRPFHDLVSSESPSDLSHFLHGGLVLVGAPHAFAQQPAGDHQHAFDPSSDLGLSAGVLRVPTDRLRSLSTSRRCW